MLSTGQRFGPYEIVSLLGAGGMGEVYRARDPRLNRSVALKVLPPEVAADAGRRQRFEQEARAASALNHPNIVAVYDIGAQEGVSYIVSELIEGEPLREAIKRGPLPLSRLLDIAGQLADALAAAHAAGIVHRDLKPENIMVTRDGRAKVLDFGLSKQTTPRLLSNDETLTAARTSPGTVLGTAAYMSPEQVRGEAVDSRSDIFSFGLILYESLIGRPPFERDTGVELMTAILREDPPELPETVAPALRQIVSHCLEKEPDRRFHSARDLGFALRTLSSGSSARASGPVPAIAPPRRGWLWPTVAAVLAALLIMIAVPHLLELEPIDLANYRLTPFATEVEPEGEGVWAPNAKSIAYLKTTHGIPQLMVRALDSPTAVQLTKSDAVIQQVFWAPDSSLLYYVSQATPGELWAISPAGGQPTHILGGLLAAAISPDGKALAIWRVETNGSHLRGSLWISSPPGTEPVQYQPSPFATSRLNRDNRLSFSPGGKSILLFTGNNASEMWLLPYPASLGQPKRLFAATDLGLAPKASWLADSRHVILSFAPALSMQSALWLADLKREKLRKLTSGTIGQDAPSASPDGSRLVFSAVEDTYSLMSLPLDGSAPRMLQASSRNDLSPSWSSQDDQIIYSTDRNGSREVWIRNLKAGIDRPVVTAHDFPPDTTTALADPVFSPDGTRFAFVRYSKDEPVTVWVAPSVGGAPIRLTRNYMQSPAWSPDGGSIVGLMQKDNPWQPAVVGVGADMSPHLVPNGPMCRTAPDWSLTGSWIACESWEGTALFTPDGGKTRLLPKLNATALAFSRDGKTIYAAGKDDGHAWLKSMDVATGAIRILADYGADFTISGGAPFHSRLSVAPDGKSVATSAVTSRSDLWLLEGYPLPRPWWHVWK